MCVQTKLYPTDLTDGQWNLIKELLPKSKTTGRPRRISWRSIINAIFYVLRSGCQWRMLPREYPNWKTVYHYFRVWHKTRLWQEIYRHLYLRERVRQQRPNKVATGGVIDSQAVKLVGGDCEERGYCAGKKVTGRKRHLLTDTLGLLIAVVVTAANISDQAGARRVFRRMGWAGRQLRKVWADWTYRGEQWLTEVLQEHAIELEIVKRDEEQKGFVVQKRRWVVERSFGWLTHNRRLAKDYEKKTASSEAFIYLSNIRLLLQREA